MLTHIGHDFENPKGVVSDFLEETRPRGFLSPPFGAFAFSYLFGGSIVGIYTYKSQQIINGIARTGQSHDFYGLLASSSDTGPNPRLNLFGTRGQLGQKRPVQ
jgi:hypothetical protein